MIKVEVYIARLLGPTIYVVQQYITSYPYLRFFLHEHRYMIKHNIGILIGVRELSPWVLISFYIIKKIERLHTNLAFLNYHKMRDYDRLSCSWSLEIMHNSVLCIDDLRGPLMSTKKEQDKMQQTQTCQTHFHLKGDISIFGSKMRGKKSHILI